MTDSLIHTADPRANYLAYKHEIDRAIEAVLLDSHHILGPAVSRFESLFADYIGVRHGVGVNSGTDAIHLALRGLGVGVGDEVITVSHTAVATVAAVEMSGAAPVLVDVEMPWFTIDPSAVEAAITPRTRAVLAVHLYGQPADLEQLLALCDKHGLALIEDCAQAHGATWRGRRVGSFGHASCFSFYPSKNLGTVGDGGMILTNDSSLAAELEMLRQYGWREPQFSETPGWNSRLGPLQAAILDVKLRHLPAMVAARRAIAARYHEAFTALPLHCPTDREHGVHAYHLYVVRCAHKVARDALRAHLDRLGIRAGIHYQTPVHDQPGYADRLAHGDLPNTKSAADMVLSLPLFPELTSDQMDQIIAGVKSFFEGTP